ncbi:MAG: hypothetical protein HETSPECPRED_000285 [Heterodermia speciosa]|uniref:Uncharacterized protein n=1 Tax=Heterodermia speciosa TaxID=116794 RepID=A0A8H3EVU9_9LECA|nr:MAG: hypothetical protein HETSPECPRED_000285 [Heterodermia speciosa]
MSDSDDDPDLKAAIALSLQDQGHPPQQKEVIDLDDSDTPDEALPVQSSEQVDMLQTRTSLNSMLGLNRKAMEAERLARKRKAVSISPPPSRAAKVACTSTAITNGSNAGSVVQSRPAPSIKTSSSTISTAPSSVTPAEPRRLEFPHGVVKKTWAFGHTRTGDDIKIEELFQPDDLNLAVLSSFQWDIAWLFRKINVQKTQVVLVMQAKDNATKSQYRRETADMPNLRLCFPSMDGQINCMHSKLMLLSYPTHIRIVVPTANLVSYDWGESGVMENMAFIIDLPRLPQLPSPNPDTSSSEPTFFARELIYFLQAQGLAPNIIQSLHNFDFSATKHLAFVHTIGGAHTGTAWQRTGSCGLGRAIQRLHLATDEPLNLDFITSSVGSLNFDFLSAIYLAAQGDDGTTQMARRVLLQGKSKKEQRERENAAREQQLLVETLKRNFRIYFPTHDTVANSTGGVDCGGTICFQAKWWEAEGFPREVMRDCRSVRRGLLMHNKVLLSFPFFP